MPIVYDTVRLQEAAYPKDGGFLASQRPLEQLVNVIRYIIVDVKLTLAAIIFCRKPCFVKEGNILSIQCYLSRKGALSCPLN